MTVLEALAVNTEGQVNPVGRFQNMKVAFATEKKNAVMLAIEKISSEEIDYHTNQKKITGILNMVSKCNSGYFFQANDNACFR